MTDLTPDEIADYKARLERHDMMILGRRPALALFAMVEAQAEKIAEQRALIIRLSGEVKAAEEMGDAAEARVADLEAALAEAKERFREYEMGHVAKGALDKAARNRDMVTMLDAALSGQGQR